MIPSRIASPHQPELAARIRAECMVSKHHLCPTIRMDRPGFVAWESLHPMGCSPVMSPVMMTNQPA